MRSSVLDAIGCLFDARCVREEGFIGLGCSGLVEVEKCSLLGSGLGIEITQEPQRSWLAQSQQTTENKIKNHTFNYRGICIPMP